MHVGLVLSSHTGREAGGLAPEREKASRIDYSPLQTYCVTQSCWRVAQLANYRCEVSSFNRWGIYCLEGHAVHEGSRVDARKFAAGKSTLVPEIARSVGDAAPALTANKEDDEMC
eukprot:2298161-Amphidinium_carterae.1